MRAPKTMCPKTASAEASDALVFAEMNFSDTACYQAMKARDARFDGRFFVGVTSTKIYCRPVCRVRIPLRKNCTFHPSAAAAETHGFRPCMKCRPELAPGFSTVDGSRLLARAAARLIEETLAQDVDLEHIADRVGVTSRHLCRIFAAEFGATPVSYAQTHRLLFAKRLLTDTTLSVTEVAFASGFSSLRRMNALFASRYRFSPSALRKTLKSGLSHASDHAAFRRMTGRRFLRSLKPERFRASNPSSMDSMLASFACATRTKQRSKRSSSSHGSA
jgi:AraC family transcriptional regulator, regulatory protein of adaptative response / DNA-3-methyladenine glycosylase II